MVSASLGVLALPLWPSAVTLKPAGRVWSQTERPGRSPLLLSTGATLAEYQVSYLARAGSLSVSMADHAAALCALVQSEEPVSLLLGDTDRGLFHLTDLSIAELAHAADGSPSSLDVSATLVQASEGTVAVGPVPAAPTPAATVAATRGSGLSGLSGTVGAGV